VRAGGTYVDDQRQLRCRLTGKLALSHRTAVQRAAQARRKRTDRDPVSEYRCTSCDWWHIGHAPRLLRRAGPRTPRRRDNPRRRGW